MNSALLNKNVQEYINANLKADLHSLLLKKSPFSEVSMPEIVQQIKGKKVAAKKFPFLEKEGILFPPNLNLEQSSSEITANFKAEHLSGKSFLDLTSGFGIDAFFLSRNFDDVFLVEQNRDLLETVRHNWNILGRKAQFINQDLEFFLQENKRNFDFIYLDPARRDSEKNKKFLLEDLSPNILETLPKLFQITEKIMVKLSPLIDIAYLINEIKNISKIQIVAVRNEVKELVVHLVKNFQDDVNIEAVNLETEEQSFSFHFNEEKKSSAKFSDAQKFLHIPNNAILKAGAFNLLSEKFQLKKLHQNTHLYTSDEFLTNFPGRTLRIEEIKPKDIKKGEKFNIISKNHPLSPDEIKKRYKVNDGGKNYLIFTQSVEGKIILKSL